MLNQANLHTTRKGWSLIATWFPPGKEDCHRRFYFLHLICLVTERDQRSQSYFPQDKMTKVTPFREVLLEMTSLSPSEIEAIRQSWDLAKEAAPFETHGPAFYHL